MRLTMANNLVAIIKNNLANKFDSQALQKRLDNKVMRSLDYELMFKTLETIFEETLLEYQGTECVEFMKKKYFDKFNHLLQLMSGIKSDTTNE